MGLTDRRRTAAVCSVVAVLVALVGACGAPDKDTQDDEQLSGAPSSEGGPDVRGAELWLSFDDPQVGFDGSPEYADAQGGPFAGRVVTANDGTAQPVPGAAGRGQALAFPSRCTAASGCPRAMVEVPADPALQPEDRPFAYGASVRLASDQTSVGSNIVQSGRFESVGGQWKLQVDGDEGQPSCIIRSGGDDPVKVRSSVSIADDAWHRIVCRRDEAGISIEVDGSVHRRPADTGSVDSGLAVRIGSPGIGDHDDQFHGVIDDVFLDIAPEE